MAISARLAAETRDPDTLFARGDKLYFAVNANWRDPNGSRRRRLFFVAVFRTLQGFSAQGPRVLTGEILPKLPDGLKLAPRRKMSRRAGGLGRVQGLLSGLSV
jgi:hypothetical protein